MNCSKVSIDMILIRIRFSTDFTFEGKLKKSKTKRQNTFFGSNCLNKLCFRDEIKHDFVIYSVEENISNKSNICGFLRTFPPRRVLPFDQSETNERTKKNKNNKICRFDQSERVDVARRGRKNAFGEKLFSGGATIEVNGRTYLFVIFLSNSFLHEPMNTNQSRPIADRIGERKLDVLVFALRLVTVLYSFTPSSSYTKVLFCAIIASAVGLRSRIPKSKNSIEFIIEIIKEEDAHYLLYSFILLPSSQLSLALIPISLHALLHSALFLSQVLDDSPMIKTGCDFLLGKKDQILRFIALIEIFLMPWLIYSSIVTRANFLLIFLHYRFLTLRYTATQNSSTRQVFTELSHKIIRFCRQPLCPPFIGRLSYFFITFIYRLAPHEP